MSKKPSFLSLTDLFCGAGGASIGAEAAGLKLVLGINHWQRAIETHSANFPNAAHDCRDVSETHPSRYGSTHLLWASPECPTWSQARGKKRNFVGQQSFSEDFEALPTEAEEKSRVTMWDVVRYSEYHGYDAVVVENVVDLMPWYLLPVWLQAMTTLGYRHRALFLNSMFFGVPQSRDRVYFVFWKKGNRAPDLDYRPRAWCPRCRADVEAEQSFKNPGRAAALASQMRYRAQYTYLCPTCGGQALPYVMPAASAIDWSIAGQRIGSRTKPLAAATMARIQAGIDRYWRRPVVLDTLFDPKLRDASTEPLPTQTSRQSLALLTTLRGSGQSALEASVRPVDEPMGTLTAGGLHQGVVEPEPLFIKNFGDVSDAGSMAHPVSEPLGSITAVDHHALLTSYYGREDATKPVTEPMGTVTGDPRHALLVKAAGSTYDSASGGPGDYLRVRTTQEPLWTQTSIPETAVVTPDAFLSSYNGGSTLNHPVSEPMGTVTGNERHALVAGKDEIEIDDCSFRMLVPAEIQLGMAFESVYVVLGNQREQVKQLGQAVTPPVPAWIWKQIVDSLR